MNEPVLIVEDDTNTAALVATYLEREGFATLSASDGQQALEMARSHRPGFVILRQDRVRYINAVTYTEALTKGVQVASKVLWMNDDIVLLRPTGWEECSQVFHLGRAGTGPS